MFTKLRKCIWNCFSKYVRLAVFEFFLEIAIEEAKDMYAKQKGVRKNKSRPTSVRKRLPA